MKEIVTTSFRQLVLHMILVEGFSKTKLKQLIDEL